ncbi:MAG: hypothetical protein GX621_13675 [Pirellulaceae bacterium]|nr:hypothetical protein [Pirellulaceae bacterium]
MNAKSRFVTLSLGIAFLALIFVSSPVFACWDWMQPYCYDAHRSGIVVSDLCQYTYPYSAYSSLPRHAADIGISRLSAWRYARYLDSSVETTPVVPLRIENPYFASEDIEAFGPGESLPQPLRVENPYFDAKTEVGT